MVRKILDLVFWVIIIVLVTDIVAFLAWSFSGQVPVDSFYFGSITRNILQFLIA